MTLNQSNIFNTIQHQKHHLNYQLQVETVSLIMHVFEHFAPTGTCLSTQNFSLVSPPLSADVGPVTSTQTASQFVGPQICGTSVKNENG